MIGACLKYNLQWRKEDENDDVIVTGWIIEVTQSRYSLYMHHYFTNDMNRTIIQ